MLCYVMLCYVTLRYVMLYTNKNGNNKTDDYNINDAALDIKDFLYLSILEAI